MSSSLKQALILAIGGLIFLYIISRLSRRRLLTTRYSLGWIGLGVFVTLGAVAMPFIGRLGQLADMSPTGVLLAISTLVLLGISVQLSISVSLLQERLRTTAEAQSLLAVEVAEIRKATK